MCLFNAGKQSGDCTLHVADATAVNKLIKSLAAQTQLEVLEITFEGAISPDEDRDSDSDDWSEAGMGGGLASEDIAEYRRVSAVTAQMFHPAWSSMCELLENAQMPKLG